MPEVSYTLDRATSIATFSIDTAGPVNSIGDRFLTDLERACDNAFGDNARGIIIESSKTKSFLDGANLLELITDSTSQTIRMSLRRYKDALAALAQSPIPVVATLSGQTALGGGFEMLLWACDHVFATSSSKVGLPEVNVGLFPAAGGTQTLARVVGFKAALEMILGGRIVPAESLVQTGLVTVCAATELISESVKWIQEHQGVTNRNYDPELSEPAALSAQEKAAIVKKARARFVSPYRPWLEAAVSALEASFTLPMDEALRKEEDLFVPLFASPNTRNKIDFFFLSTGIAPRLIKTDASKAVPVPELAIVGAGLMGQGIAQVSAEKGIKTLLIDVDEDATQRAIQAMRTRLEKLVAGGRWSSDRMEQVMSNVRGSTDYDELKAVPLVIECVFEDLALKRKILGMVQQANPDVIFASNTSTIPMADISKDAARPEKVVGMHFFSPVPLMPLLEVIQGDNSSPAAVATAVETGKRFGKTLILVSDGPGFYTSRTFGGFINNGLRLAELGMSPWQVDRAALHMGFPQGPLHIYGTVGGSVVYHAGKFMQERMPDHMRMPATLENLFNAGYVGAGKPSFYSDYRAMTPDESVLEHIVKAEGLPTPTDEEARDTLILGMVNEAFRCLGEGVLHNLYSMDLGAVFGIGFPDCWHGPARYVSLKGVKAVRDRLDELASKFDIPALAPAPEFDRLIACGLDSALI